MEPGQSTPVGSVEIDDSLENSQEKDVEEGSRREPSYQGTSSSRENPESLNVDLFKSLLESIQWQIQLSNQNLDEKLKQQSENLEAKLKENSQNLENRLESKLQENSANLKEDLTSRLREYSNNIESRMQENAENLDRIGENTGLLGTGMKLKKRNYSN